MTSKYLLINKDGCVMTSTLAKSFIKARKFFSVDYEGSYTIRNTADGICKNVRL